jgi:hypothetical protein
VNKTCISTNHLQPVNKLHQASVLSKDNKRQPIETPIRQGLLLQLFGVRKSLANAIKLPLTEKKKAV